MKRLHKGILTFTILVLATGGAVQAASPYDDYYNHYRQPDANTHAPRDYPADNDSYYTAPEQYPTDNDAYYSAPGSYSNYYPSQPSTSRTNCNTIGDMPSCGSD